MSDDSTPDTAVGAHSVYDNGPQQTPAEVSAAALAGAKAALAGQLQDMVSGEGVGSDSAGGVQRTIAQTAPGLPPITFHTASYGYEIPLG